jgi:hypothetical protein
MRDLNKELTKKALQKQSRIHYITHDRRLAVWIWHQVILVEVSGSWDPETAKRHLDRLFDDFKYIRQYWEKAFAIVDLHRFEIQTVAFRTIVKNYWAKFFNRSDLMICFIENNMLRRAIRAAMLQLITRSHNVHICTNYKEVSRLISTLESMDEVQVDSKRKNDSVSNQTNIKLGEKGKLPMKVSENITLRWLHDHAQQHYVGADGKWTVTAWNNVVFLKISKNWTPEEGEEYVGYLSGIPRILNQKWERIYFIFDISEMVFKPEDLHLYMRSKWLETLEHEELSVCLVESKKMRRMLMSSMYKLLGKRDRIHIFASPERALEWVRVELVRSRSGSEDKNGTPK